MPQNTKIKKNISKKFIKSKFVKEKISNLSNIIEKCMIFIQKWKTLDIITASQLNLGLSQLENINSLLRNVEFSFKTNKSNKKNYTTIINSLQNINNELASYFKLYGSNSIDSLLKVCFNHNYLEENSLINNPKYKPENELYIDSCIQDLIANEEFVNNPKGKILPENFEIVG